LLSLVSKGTTGTDRLIWNVDTWLNYDWNGDGTEEAPGALATFGVYRGHDRVIYWHEVR
jgi:MSHA biogenesis protein MshQ